MISENEPFNFIKHAKIHGVLPMEEMLEKQKHKCPLKIGIPKETAFQENRVSLVPDAVGLLVNNGHKVYIQSDAGLSAHFPDSEYAEAGATIVYSLAEVYQADIILKVSPLSTDELNLLKPKQTVISALHQSIQTENYFRKLIAAKATAIAFEFIKDKAGSFPVLRAVSEIAGNTSILIAADYLSSTQYGKGNMLGGFSGITPTEIVILGAGTVGEFAARAAMGLGATIKVFDNSLYKLRRLQDSLNARVFTSIIQPKVLLKSLKNALVVIGALHSNQGRTPVVISEEMVKEMKQGSVIIDVSIDQGGVVETSHVTTHTDPVFQMHGVTHYCVPNIASRVPHTASYALSNFFGPLLLSVAENGGINEFLTTDFGLRKGVYVYNGIVTHQNVANMFNLPFQDIELLMAAFR
ncbi:MAG: alanine dehydrogenase [Bacteroidota bacterium]